MRTGKETYFEYKFGNGLNKTKMEEKLRVLMGVVAELVSCRQKEIVKEEE